MVGKKEKELIKYKTLLSFSSLEEDEALSSDEDLAFRDDLNDQSYDPRDERFVSVKKKR